MKPASPDVEKYLSSLPEERRVALEAVRQLIVDNLNPGFEEGVQYGMLGYYVPHALYPKGYHANPKQPLPCINLGSQKNHMALYLMCLYAGSELELAFKRSWERSGKKLDMGKSCVRFRKLDDLALDALAETLQRLTVEQHIANYEASISVRSAKPVEAPAGSTKKKATSRNSTAAAQPSHSTTKKPTRVNKRPLASRRKPSAS
jgi:Domain of unknown function (DU1801)